MTTGQTQAVPRPTSPGDDAPTATRALPARHRPRRDIQGLRAVAVIGVVLDHLLGWPTGGFAGVDVFFVLSGFLITDLMLREHERRGGISILGFYRRRVKRIMPAALLVLVVTVAAARVLFSLPRWQSTVTDAQWSLGFVANWRFATTGTDYFTADAPPSPLQHFWSLAVEEQFYVVWPTLVIAVLLLGRRTGSARAPRLLLGVVTALLAASSFAWALHETAVRPDLAYFSTFSRAWELAAGALLAAAAPRLARALRTVPRRALGAVAWSGLVGILVSYAVLDGRAFPAPWAALPVLSTVAIVAAGLAVDGPWVLRNRVACYLGDISYSLYLWHFPVIILGQSVLGTGPWAAVVLGLVVVVLAVYGYELVEDPLRRNRWRPIGRDRPRASTRYRVIAFSLLATIVVGTLASITVASSGPTQRPVAAPASSASVDLNRVERRWQSSIVDALEADDWPTLEPSMDDAIASPQAASEVVACGAAGSDLDADACTFGSPTAGRRAVVLGDSVSLTYLEPVREALEQLQPGRWQVTSVGTFGCPAVDLDLGTSQDEVDDCARRRAQAADAIEALDPDLVIVSDSADSPSELDSGSSVSESEWRAGMLRTLRPLLTPQARLVVLAPPPGEKDPAECYTPLSEPDDCVGTVTDGWTDRAETERTLAADLGGDWVDATPWFCVGGVCPSFVDGVPVRSDTVHMTTQYARLVVPLLAARMDPLLHDGQHRRVSRG